MSNTPGRTPPGSTRWRSRAGRCVCTGTSAVVYRRIRTGTPALGASIIYATTPVALCDQPTTGAINNAITKLYVEHHGLLGVSRAHQMAALQTGELITTIK